MKLCKLLLALFAMVYVEQINAEVWTVANATNQRASVKFDFVMYANETIYMMPMTNPNEAPYYTTDHNTTALLRYIQVTLEDGRTIEATREQLHSIICTSQGSWGYSFIIQDCNNDGNLSVALSGSDTVDQSPWVPTLCGGTICSTSGTDLEKSKNQSLAKENITKKLVPTGSFAKK